MRLFIAIPLPDSAKQALENLKKPIDSIRWQPSHQFHITLKFLGETPEQQLQRLQAHLRSVNQSAFNLTVQGLGAFPKKGKPRVIWAGVEKSAALEQLQQTIEEISVGVGFEKESRSFTPHITLGKVRKAATQEVDLFLSSCSGWGSEEFLVDQLALYASHISSSGARHEVIKNYFLNE